MFSKRISFSILTSLSLVHFSYVFPMTEFYKKSSLSSSSGLFCDFETACAWEWVPSSENFAGFEQVSHSQIQKMLEMAEPYTFAGPPKSSEMIKNPGREHHLLFLSLRSGIHYNNNMTQIKSPWYRETGEYCKLEADFLVYQFNDIEMPIKILIKTKNHTGWADVKNLHNDVDKTTIKLNSWRHAIIPIGRIASRFRLIIEIQFGHVRPSYIAIDNIAMVDCIIDMFHDDGECTGVHCNSENRCIKRDYVCDINKDCPSGEDEDFCDDLPHGAFCNFENAQDCGWKNAEHALNKMEWKLHQGATTKAITGPSVDHTYGNSTGYYMLCEPPNVGSLGDEGILVSPVFPAPPCYHSDPKSPFFQSCKLRLYYHKMGRTSGSTLAIDVISAVDSRSGHHGLKQTSGDQGVQWMRFVGIIPNITYPYRVRITNFRGLRAAGDIGIDDISMSLECFGLGVTESEARKCPLRSTIDPSTTTTTYTPPTTGETVYVINTCGAIGNKGPNQTNCEEYYSKSNQAAPFVHSVGLLQGFQTWKTPNNGYYTLIAKGASGGTGVQTQAFSTKGAAAKGIFYLKKGTELHILVGQEGLSACGPHLQSAYKAFCENKKDPPDDDSWLEKGMGRLFRIRNKTLPGGGGGGGGASYIFIKRGDETIPLVIAGGGGGLGWSAMATFSGVHNGREYNSSFESANGQYLSNNNTDGAGPGGGLWGQQEGVTAGFSLMKGGEGGKPCSARWRGYGGFGGGGGGCFAGGGGGGFKGGDVLTGPYSHGEGGLSYSSGNQAETKAAMNLGPGIVFIIPSIRNACGCQHLCAHLDEQFNDSVCLCTNNQILADDGITCIAYTSLNDVYNWTLRIVPAFLFLIFVGVSIIVCYRYKNRKRPSSRILNNFEAIPDIQLSRLRNTSSSLMVSEFNPNYEFGGGNYTIKDLKQIQRKNLTLVKALGQGAFGEVYKGYLKSYAGDSVELPVAVKTLPELTTSQAQFDFIMEALIMSKFNHPNVVQFIGVCFERLPQFIVLELLPGGDLKNFLRESRPQDGRPSPLAVRDLLQCALDVARGCEYLEANHFIHRDISARNCLLTTKGPGRVVKIADFGMARDIYRNDYYKKNGKTTLPVKWMPPEAFLEGVFHSKTDVWSFGVLLWEVMTMGYMPYPGINNQELIQYVGTHGGRLECPNGCPAPIYRLMASCWQTNANDRPPFTVIIERLGYCLQDPDVINCPLPRHHCPIPSESPMMRPEDFDRQAPLLRNRFEPPSPTSADYLIPKSRSASTMRTDLQSLPSMDSANDSLDFETIPPPVWETSFSSPEPPNVVAPRPPSLISPSLSPLPKLLEEREDSSTTSEHVAAPTPDYSQPLLNESAKAAKNFPIKSKNYATRNFNRNPHKNNNTDNTADINSNNPSISSTTSANSSATTSTLPLNPAALPLLPPPLQYINVELSKPNSTEPYSVVETKEHREISC